VYVCMLCPEMKHHAYVCIIQAFMVHFRSRKIKDVDTIFKVGGGGFGPNV
jgi:hypothetical protein